ncbi:hypothetical protein EIP86_009773 [Pleurotus ostreatoroseus]|nr:hypothetical protein EIP86_009773 [Pleurotus ostreatoroseus]
MDQPVLALGFRNLLIHTSHALAGWAPRTNAYPTVGTTPFDERDVKIAHRTPQGDPVDSYRPAQISAWQATCLRDQISVSGTRVARILIRNGILTTTGDDGATPVHTKVTGFLHIIESDEQDRDEGMAAAIPVGAIVVGNPPAQQPAQQPAPQPEEGWEEWEMEVDIEEMPEIVPEPEPQPEAVAEPAEPVEEGEERPRKRTRPLETAEDVESSVEEMYETREEERERLYNAYAHRRRMTVVSDDEEEVDQLADDEDLSVSGPSGSAGDNLSISDYRALIPSQDLSGPAEQSRTAARVRHASAPPAQPLHASAPSIMVQARHASEARTEVPTTHASTSEKIRYVHISSKDEDKEHADPTRSDIVPHSDHHHPLHTPLTQPTRPTSANHGGTHYRINLLESLAHLGALLSQDDPEDPAQEDDRADRSTIATPGTGNHTPAIVALGTLPSIDPDEYRTRMCEFEARLDSLIEAAAILERADNEAQSLNPVVERTGPGPMEPPSIVPPDEDEVREQFATALQGINANGIPSDQDLRAGTRLASPAVHVSQVATPVPQPQSQSQHQPQPQGPLQSFTAFWNRPAANQYLPLSQDPSTDRADQDIPPRTAVALGPGGEEKEREDQRAEQEHRNVSLPPLQHPDSSTPEVEVAPPSYSPLPSAAPHGFRYPPPYHPPQNMYHSVYSPHAPQPPVIQHQQFRNVFILSWRHIYLQACILGFPQWAAFAHDVTHSSDDPIDRAYHDRVFLLTSEWSGNPFLWAYEESILVQCAEFFKHLAANRSYDTRTHLRLIDEMLAFRVDGPDHFIMIQQRLSMLYGRVGEIVPGHPSIF